MWNSPLRLHFSALIYNRMNFWNFQGICQYLQNLSLKSFAILWEIFYIPCLLLIILLHFTRGERKIWLKVRKCQNTLIFITCKIFFVLIYEQLFLLWTVKFCLELTLSFEKTFYTTFDRLSVPNLDLSEIIGKGFAKWVKF